MNRTEWEKGKYLDHTVCQSLGFSQDKWVSRWYPISGHLDGQCWNLYQRPCGGFYSREVLCPNGLGLAEEIAPDDTRDVPSGE